MSGSARGREPTLVRRRIALLEPSEHRGVPTEKDLEVVFKLTVERRLVCRVCRLPITADEHRIPIEGRHVHRRTNPAGFDFEFGCFDDAPGAFGIGEATAEHTWFAGYVWTFAICRSCGAHLGWQFEGAEPSFWGLILSKLEEEEDVSGD